MQRSLPVDRVIRGDALRVLKTFPDESVDCVVTSPPYWAMRDYGVRGQLGLEPTLSEYLEKLLGVFDELRRVLKSTGTCWVNMGDTYSSPMKGAGGKASPESGDGAFARLINSATFPQRKFQSGLPVKSLCQVPARFAIGMTDRRWVLRNEIIWHKPNCMPQSARDRFTVDFEKLFFFVKGRHYHFERQFEPLRDRPRSLRPLARPGTRRKARKDPLVSVLNPKTAEASRRRVLTRGRNIRSVWSIPPRPHFGGHTATFPPELIETPILAGCPVGGVVLDPFSGTGTTALVARRLGRRFVGIELNPRYARASRQRLLAAP